MDTLVAALTALFTAANSLTPLALVGLTLGVLYIQIFRQPSKQELNVVKENHLHELPEIAETLRKASDTLQRMEVSQEKHFGIIISKLDNR